MSLLTFAWRQVESVKAVKNAIDTSLRWNNSLRKKKRSAFVATSAKQASDRRKIRRRGYGK